MVLRQDSVESTGDWGYFADEQPGSQELSPSSSSGDESSVDSESHSSSLNTTLSAASTAGLAELNTWLWDSCELGVSAWMRSGVAANRDGRRRCYFMTGGDSDWRCYGHYQPTGGGPGHMHHQHRSAALAGACACTGGFRPRRQVVAAGRRRKTCGSHCRGQNARGTTPQQLWCVTPLEPGRVQANRWETIETVMTPRLCPRVFSREFSGGIIVGASFGSIRVVSNSLTGARYSEFLLMVSVGERCRRAWRRQFHFKRHAQRHWARWSPVCRAAWTLAETERRWWPCVDDFPYVASRQAALETVLREILFSTDSPTELVELAGSDNDDIGPPPSLAEVKTRHADDTAVAAHQLAASEEEYAALFGGRLAMPRAVGLSVLSDVVVASLTQSCRRNDLCVLTCSPLNRTRHASLSGSKRRSRSPLSRRTSNRRSTSEPAYSRHHTFSEMGDVLPTNADQEHVDDDDSPGLAVATSVFRRRKPNNELHIQMSPTEAALVHPALDTTQAREAVCLSPIGLIRACFPAVPVIDNHARNEGKSITNRGYRRANRRLRDRAGAFENGPPADTSHRPRSRPKLNGPYRQSAVSQIDSDNPILLPPLIAALRRGMSSNRTSQQKQFVRPVEPHPLFSSTLKEHAVYDFHDSRPRVIVA